MFVFYLAAVVCFVLGTWPTVVTTRRPINLVALGLALAFFVPLWAAGQAIR